MERRNHGQLDLNEGKRLRNYVFGILFGLIKTASPETSASRILMLLSKAEETNDEQLAFHMRDCAAELMESNSNYTNLYHEVDNRWKERWPP